MTVTSQGGGRFEPNPWLCPDTPSGAPGECLRTNFLVNLQPSNLCTGGTLATGQCISHLEDSSCYGGGIISSAMGTLLLFAFLVYWLRSYFAQRKRMRPGQPRPRRRTRSRHLHGMRPAAAPHPPQPPHPPSSSPLPPRHTPHAFDWRGLLIGHPM